MPISQQPRTSGLTSNSRRETKIENKVALIYGGTMVFSARAIFINFHLFSFCLTDVESLIHDDYRDYSSVTSYLSQYALNNSDLMTLYSVGRSVLGRELWVICMTASDQDEMVPNVKIIANIHGNEPVGREISFELIKFLVKEYKAGNPRVKWLLDSTKIHILPSMNPDGFERALKDHRKNRNGGSNACNTRGETGRMNERYIDLNKNFPGVFRPNTCPEQPESKAVMRWMNETQFVLSLSLHSGSLLVSYPFDDLPDGPSPSSYSMTPDDDVFRALARSYTEAHSTLHRIPSSCNKNTMFLGTINGAEWSPISGGMQDYNYIYKGCLELTVELACCKFPRFEEMRKYWDQNSEAILTWASFAHRGVKGVVYDSYTERPVEKASLKILGRNSTFWSNRKGEFWRPLLAGNYQLQAKAEGYKEKAVSFTIRNVELDKKYDLSPVILKIGLSPIGQDCDHSKNVSTLNPDKKNSGSIRIFSQHAASSTNQLQGQSKDQNLNQEPTQRTNHERDRNSSRQRGENRAILTIPDTKSTVSILDSEAEDEIDDVASSAQDGIDTTDLELQTFRVEPSIESSCNRPTPISFSFLAVSIVTAAVAIRYFDQSKSINKIKSIYAW